VTQHAFIFSNRIRYRLARHAAFWFACWLFFLILYYIPYGVFPGWNTEKFAGNVAHIGLLRWLWLRLFNSVAILLPLLMFAYAVVYFLLPRFFLNKRNGVVTACLFAGLLILMLFVQYLSGTLVAHNWVSANAAIRKMPEAAARINNTWKIVLFNYPIVTGFAIIIKMMKQSWLKQQETHMIIQEKATAELQLLKAQIHPHFLFNTLNNIYFFTLTVSEKAPEMLMKLTDILSYILNECGYPLVPLSKELKMIEDYIALERIRYDERFKMEFTINGDYSNKTIAPLLLIPLVENSFKHGASKMLEQPWVHLNITIKAKCLSLLLSNSMPQETTWSHQNHHIGLNNVKKRLELLYPDAHELTIGQSKHNYEVFMKVNLEDINAGQTNVQTETKGYAMA
jgi:sensor histidine kinase YesM